ncbi:YciI family protein [Rhodococcus koreensis]|uniref:YciI family protein n=1 Tax=Rhodococcus koreensis TaxID=99653 RepID=UPI00367075D0
MSLFVVEYTYSAETAAGREEHRPAHRAWLVDLVEKKTVVASGPFADRSGAFIVVVGPDATAVEELFDQDPFARHDLLTDKRIVEWAPLVGPFND